MNILINNKNYQVIITHKNNKNMYLRVKSDLKIYITCPYYIKEKAIIKFIENHLAHITKIINTYENKKIDNHNKFLFLGKAYDILYTNKNEVVYGSTKVFVGKKTNIDNYYRSNARIIFKERLDYCYSLFEEKIYYPILKIRKMTSKWGVNNITKKTITLNLELIKLDIKYIDYVIIHELAHFIHGNHSKNFWCLVEKYSKDYKKLRKEMKNIL